jgi:hypothetical protein
MTKRRAPTDIFSCRAISGEVCAGAALMLTRLAAAAAIVFFLATAFRSGWRRSETDFPNYYTATVLIRKGLPIREYYDWTWFQRQMNYAGIERQLGSYQPQTPLSVVPLIGLAWFAPQTAKQIWLIMNLGFLAATVWLLARVTGFRTEQIVLLAFLGFDSLYTNFLFGQYYIFLLFLLTLTFYFLDHKKAAASGAFAGLAFVLKLYSGPLLVYFALKRNWRAVAGFVAMTAVGAAIALALFGWRDLHFYATQILPRAIEGEIADPYNPRSSTIATLLRRLFLPEPELNPEPMWNAPIALFFLRPLFNLLILGATSLGLAGPRTGSERRDFAWFLIAILLLSANIGSYVYMLLLLPVALLLVDAGTAERIFLIGAFFAACCPLGTAWSWIFPKLWVLLALYFVVGRDYLRSLSPKFVVALVILAVVVASVDARRHAIDFAAEPGQNWERVATEKGAIFSSSPAVSNAGLFYQSIGGDRYILRWLHNGTIEKLQFEGHAFQPVAPKPDGPVYFELVAHGTSATMAFDPVTRQVARVAEHAPENVAGGKPIASPDGQWAAFELPGEGPRRIAMRNMASGDVRVLTGGNCNSWAPVWELDSKSLIFASDCGRGMSLPSLYRATVGAEPAAPAVKTP